MPHEPVHTSGKVLRRYMVEEEVYPEVVVTNRPMAAHPPAGHSRAYWLGWDTTDWLIRHPCLAGIIVTLIISAALLLTVHLRWGIRLGPPCPSPTIQRATPAGRTLPAMSPRR